MFCLSKHQLIEIWIISTFGPLWIMLLWTFVYKFFCGHMFTLPRSGITRSYVNSMCSVLRTCQKCFPKQLCHFTFPWRVYEYSNFFTSSPILVIFQSFIFTAMLLSVMVLICIFLMANDVSMFSCVHCLYAFLNTLQPKKKIWTNPCRWNLDMEADGI